MYFKEQKKLKAIVSKVVSPARTIRRANLLLKYAACVNDNISISKFLDVVGLSKATLHNILKDYQERGIDCIYRKKRKTPPVEAKITGEVEAHLIALACHSTLVDEVYCCGCKYLGGKHGSISYSDAQKSQHKSTVKE